MNTIKEKLTTSLGIFGFILYYALFYFICFMPLFILNFPFWVGLILVGIILYIPFIGHLTHIAIYILALIKEIGRIKSGDSDFITILFFLALAIDAICVMMPVITVLFSFIISLITSVYEAIFNRLKRKTAWHAVKNLLDEPTPDISQFEGEND